MDVFFLHVAKCLPVNPAGLDKLDLWFDRALTAASAADIFKDDEG